ncbi:hypothetical protein [Actinoplanes subtropicus]|uniref:hypothetical protein n=1 Tax=Actinoplanes subtropicus TaxID=543632 RepID=UPI0012FA7A18|nr:hypothetical protein [Actinoplanes subtropicus]
MVEHADGGSAYSASVGASVACHDGLMGAGSELRDWLDGVWSRTSVIQIVEGGEDAGPFPGRAVLAEIRDAASVDLLRKLTTIGSFTGDICRCPGGSTVVLRGAAGQLLASASIHAYGSVSWERSRFRNDLVVADPAGLHLFLAETGMPCALGAFLAPLVDRLNLYEQRPQFRPAGKAGWRYLVERGVPESLYPSLLTVTGQQAGELPAEQVDDIRRRLIAAMPSAVDRALVLLSWLGRLPVPAEALWGEGRLIRQLLADLSAPERAAAASGAASADVAMGVVNMAMHGEDDGTLAAAIGPTLRQLFPPSQPAKP